MKVLVTGGAGFIGSHVVDALREARMDVMSVDSLDPGVHRRPPDYLRGDVDYCFADLRHWVPDRRFDDVEAVVHLAALGGVSRAARDPASVIGANAYGTARLVATAAWGRHGVWSSRAASASGANYPSSVPHSVSSGNRRCDLELGVSKCCEPCGMEAEILPIGDTTAPEPLEAYGASKYMQELCFRGFARCPVSILRFSSVYGSRLRLDDGEATIIARILAWIRAGRQPQLFEDGRQIRDWVFVGDVVAAVRAALERDDMPSITNVCSGVPTRLIDACERVAEVLGESTVRPLWWAAIGPATCVCLGDPSRLRDLLGRAPMCLRTTSS
jgi:dTDP-L-rhamnose 4-epimerase